MREKQQQEQKNEQLKSHQSTGPLLTFMCGILLGATIQSLVFRQWVIAEVELTLMVVLVVGALLGATIPKRGKG